MPGRIWSSPVVADLVLSRPGLEVVVAARGQISVFDEVAGSSAKCLPWPSGRGNDRRDGAVPTGARS